MLKTLTLHFEGVDTSIVVAESVIHFIKTIGKIDVFLFIEGYILQTYKPVLMSSLIF